MGGSSGGGNTFGGWIRNRRQEFQKDVQAQYEKAKAYTTGVVLAGYASFFALWSLTKSELSPLQTLVSALSISISVILFVLWEIRTMILSGQRFHELLSVADNDEDFDRRYDELRARESAGAKQEALKWRIQVAVTVGTAMVGAITLISAFICGLFREFSRG